MKLIKADHQRRIAIPGVPGLVQRPVDIDASRTGFSNLRSLRIYRFEEGVTIDGHAEEDEVFVVVIAGSVEFTISGDNSGEESRSFNLSAPNRFNLAPCVAYLPPQSAYRLIPKSDAEVAYVRATPASGHPGQAFAPGAKMNPTGATVLLEETTYAQRLRLRLTQIKAANIGVDFAPLPESEAECEALLHVRTVPDQGVATVTTEGDSILLSAWDSVAVAPGDRPILHFAAQSAGLVLAVSAI